MAKMVKVACDNCKILFNARVADRRRGWGRFCSKSCKAEKQERKNGYYRAHLERSSRRESGECFPSMAEGEVQ